MEGLRSCSGGFLCEPGFSEGLKSILEIWQNDPLGLAFLPKSNPSEYQKTADIFFLLETEPTGAKAQTLESE